MLSSDFSVCSISSDVLTHLHSARTRLQRALVGEGGVLWNSTKNMSCNHPLKTWVCWTGQVGMRRGEEVGCELLMQVKIWTSTCFDLPRGWIWGKGKFTSLFLSLVQTPCSPTPTAPRSVISPICDVTRKNERNMQMFLTIDLKCWGCVSVCVCWNI